MVEAVETSGCRLAGRKFTVQITVRINVLFDAQHLKETNESLTNIN